MAPSDDDSYQCNFPYYNCDSDCSSQYFWDGGWDSNGDWPSSQDDTRSTVAFDSSTESIEEELREAFSSIVTRNRASLDIIQLCAAMILIRIAPNETEILSLSEEFGIKMSENDGRMSAKEFATMMKDKLIHRYSADETLEEYEFKTFNELQCLAQKIGSTFFEHNLCAMVKKSNWFRTVNLPKKDFHTFMKRRALHAD
jgi:hypothetical protein